MRHVPCATAMALLALSACATHNLTPLAPRFPAQVNVVHTEDFSTTTCATFSVFPLSLTSGAALIKGTGHERPLLFSLLNAMEAKGYRFVPLDRSPDLLVTVDLAWHRTELDPKKPVEATRPARLTPPNLAAYGILTGPWLSQQASAGWGALPETADGAKLFPGYPSGRKFAPGNFETRLTIAVLDGKSLEEIWTGAGVCVSGNANPVVGSQPVLWKILNAFPAAILTRLNVEDAGVPGFAVRVATNDGADYFPTVLNVKKGSPAWKGGMKTFDMILAVGGESAKNTSLSDVEKELNGPDDSCVTLTVWRKTALEWHRNPIQTALCLMTESCERANQIHLTLTREKLVQTAGAASPVAPVSPALFDIPPRRAELFQMCILPATGCAMLGILIYAGVAGMN